MHSGCECVLAYVLSLIYPFFACQRALVSDCWQFSDSAYLHQICTVIVGWVIKGWFIRATEKRSASRILLHPLSALCVLCVVWPCYPFICPLPGLALFANFAYVRIIQHSPTHPARSPFTLILYPQQQCLLQQPLNPTLVLLEIRDLC